MEYCYFGIPTQNAFLSLGLRGVSPAQPVVELLEFPSNPGMSTFGSLSSKIHSTTKMRSVPLI